MFSSTSKSLATWFSYLLIVLISVGPFFGFFVQKALSKDVTTIELFLCLLILFLIFLERRNFKFPLYLLIYLAFTIYVILSDKFLVGRNLNLKYFRSNLIFIGFLIILIIENTDFSKQFFRQVLLINFVVIIIAFAVLLIQEFYDNSFFVNQITLEHQIDRSYHNYKLPSIYTYYTVLMKVSLSFSPVVALLIGDEFSKANRGLPVNEMKIFFLYIVLFVFSFLSRTRIMLVFFVIILFLYFRYKKFSIQSITTIFLMLLFACLLIIYVGPQFGMKSNEIIEKRILEKDRGGFKNSTRILAFKIFKQVYKEDKVFGKGRYSLSRINFDKQGKKDIELIRVLHGRSSQIHIGYLSLLYWYGIVGALLFLTFLALTAKFIYQNAREFNYWGPFIGWLIYITYHFTDVAFDIKSIGIILVIFTNKALRDLHSEEELLYGSSE